MMPKSTVRSGNAAVKVIIAIVLFLAIFGGLKMMTRPGADITVLETRRVSGKTLGGGPIQMKQLKFTLSSEATGGGLGGIAGLPGHLRTPAAKSREPDEKPDMEADSEGTDGIESKLISLENDGQGDFLLVRLRLSRDYLERQGKISNLKAVVSTPDIQLCRSGGSTEEPVFVMSAVRGQTQTPRGPATQYNFGGGNTVTLYKDAPNELWLAAGQVKQTQELTSTVEIACLFGRPAGEGALSLQVLGTPNVSLEPGR